MLREYTGFDAGAISAEGMLLATSELRGDSTQTLEELGLELRPIEETIESQMRWMYENGHLSARAAGALAAR